MRARAFWWRSAAPTGCRFRELAREAGVFARRAGTPLHRPPWFVYRAGRPGFRAAGHRPRRGSAALPGCCVGVCAVRHRASGPLPGECSTGRCSTRRTRELVAAEAAAGDELSPRRSVAAGSARPGGFRVVHNSRLGHWCMGFRCCGLNDAVNPELKAADPMATVQRIAIMLFEE